MARSPDPSALAACPAPARTLAARASLQRPGSAPRQSRQLFVKHGDRPFVMRYTLVRSRRRTIGFQIDARGLTIAAPHWVPQSELDNAIREKAGWILAKQEEWLSHERARQAAAPRLVDGGHFSWLGRNLPLRLVPARCPPGADLVLREDGLQIVDPRVGDPVWVERRINEWMKGQARMLFAERIQTYARRLGREPTSWGLSSARSRWGSCNSAGRILLSWRLMHFPLHLIDYVIAHEVAHLAELNHSPRFWAVVERLMPDYREARQALKQSPDAFDGT